MMIVAMIIMVGVIRLLFLIWFLERPRVEADRDAEESLVAFSYDDGVDSDYDDDDDDDDNDNDSDYDAGDNRASDDDNDGGGGEIEN